jgi:DDE superfamily endonuclease
LHHVDVGTDTGATNDSRVLNESSIYTADAAMFPDSRAYILGDSAYRLTNRVIVPYSEREIGARTLTNEEQQRRNRFNGDLSSARVKVEHAFGTLKARFPLLSGLPNLVGSQCANDKVEQPPLRPD